MNSEIIKIIDQSISVKKKLVADSDVIKIIGETAELITNSLKNGHKILLCGNGGSAADAQHIAAEFSGRFYHDRDPLYAEALHVNTSYMTAVANDYTYDEVYSRLIKAKGRKGDVLICISTSGNSKNVVKAAERAKIMGINTVGLTGKKGGDLMEYCDNMICVPSEITPRIQEAHIMIGHIICELVEAAYFNLK